MAIYDTPGVYIEEQTGPGVIAGVGTSTAAFIGPAVAGPLLQPRRISSWEEFLSLYAVVVNGALNPYITTPRRFYLPQAVRGFFQNGGAQAYIVRVGTAANTAWDVMNQDGGGAQAVFRIEAVREGVAGDTIALDVQPANATGAGGVAATVANAVPTLVNGVDLTFAAAPPFRMGDVVTEDESSRATVASVTGNTLRLSQPVAGLAAGDTLRIANLIPGQTTLRLASTAGLFPGSVVLLQGDDAGNPGNPVEDYAVVQSVDAAGFVTFAPAPALTHNFNLDVAQANAPVLISQEFSLLVTPPGGPAQQFNNLSLDPLHPGYVFSAVSSPAVRIAPPAAPPTTAGFPDRLPAAGAPAITANGADDDPGALGSAGFEAGLDALRDIDDVNIVCIPDAAAHPECITIQNAMILHCVDPRVRDRVAVLDSRPNNPPSGPGSVEEHRASVESPSGFAALYYPWLQVRDPLSATIPPATMFIPPSGHIAGIYARTDQERGVHKAPANTDVRGVLGLERRLSDGQQGPLNLGGVNVLRIFQGSNTVVVWGARTTVDPDINDWIYVNVRRLMLYIEESIEEGIRWAVFEPNGLPLWQQLKRAINEFLTRVWRDGALFGDSPDKAFYVRIDEALNPPSVRALGRLYIEIGVAAVRPAEFIIVRIGLWDGGAEVTEG
ncbi:MAG TPA: phage tail sheath subtilisin-like domain-containing protein [Thermoanaerobaculia bacterium]|nr:phage tail sheath subtilisin-like domain-containing protein [Thermoanaerobaculia bacterium]